MNVIVGSTKNKPPDGYNCCRLHQRNNTNTSTTTTTTTSTITEGTKSLGLPPKSLVFYQARTVWARSAGPAQGAWCLEAAPLAPNAAPGCPMGATGTAPAPGTASTPTGSPAELAATTRRTLVNIIFMLHSNHN